MGRLNLKWLVIAAIVLGLALIAYQQTDTQQPVANGVLLPELAGQLDEVTRVEILTAGEQLELALVRGENGWGLEQRAGYPIMLDELRSVLRAMAQVEPAEAMTSNPEFYARLHVTDIADPASAATAVRIYGADQQLAGLLLGKPIYRGSESYSYLRLEGEPQSWLVRGSAELNTDPVQWLAKDVLNISRSEINKVSIQHPDGEVLVVKRENEADSKLTVQQLPKDAELLYASVGNGPAEGLENLRLEDVIAVGDFNWTRDAVVKTELTKRDGTVISVKAERRKTEYFIALAASYSGEDKNLLAEAAALNARLQPWVYQVLPYKYQTLSKRMKDMLKPK